MWWLLIARPIENGGWGIFDVDIFNKALINKNLWRAVDGRGIWSNIIKEKYFYEQSFSNSIANGKKKEPNFLHLEKRVHGIGIGFSNEIGKAHV